MPKSIVCVLPIYHVYHWFMEVLGPIVYKERIHTCLFHFWLDQDVLFLIIDLCCSVKKIAKYLTESVHFINRTRLGLLLNIWTPRKGWGSPDTKHLLSERFLFVVLPFFGISFFFLLIICNRILCVILLSPTPIHWPWSTHICDGIIAQCFVYA